jgi:Icc protein
MSSIRLIQFTDPHLFGGEMETLRGVATLPALECALAQARAHDWNAEALLVTGDIVQDEPAGYPHFRRLFSGLGKPVLCIPGNHDDPAQMKRALAGPPFQIGGYTDFGSWRVVLVDSVLPGAAHGRIAPAELEALDRALASAGKRHALVCLHHHPVSMSSRWLDQVGIVNAGEFFAVIERHRNVRAILWGHVHQSFDGLRSGVRLLATPSTCAQFLPRADEFAIDPRPPAYRTLELRDDGSLMTDVVWVDECASGSSRSASSAA